MAELNKGFVPFDMYNAGNDYNPLGYGTAKVMKLSGDSIFALSGTPSGTDHSDINGNYEMVEFDVLRAVVDTSFNKHEFINGVWHATSDTGGEGTYERPSMVEFKMNIPDFITIETQSEVTNLSINAKINQGSAEQITTTIKLVAGDQSIALYTTTDSTIAVSIEDPDVLDVINELIQNGIEFKIVATIDDGKQPVITEKPIKSVHYSYYGWMDINDITPENIVNTDVSKGRCAKAIDYPCKKAYFGAFYPIDQNMYIAIPVAAGLIKSICNGAALYTVGTTNTDFIRSKITMNGVEYYLYILQYINHGTYNMLSVFDKGE